MKIPSNDLYLRSPDLWGNKVGESALVIACAPVQTNVQNKLDELFASGEHAPVRVDSNVEPKASSKAKAKSTVSRRRLKNTSAAGRQRRLEDGNAVKVRANTKAPVLPIGVTLFGVVPVSIALTAIAFLSFRLF